MSRSRFAYPDQVMQAMRNVILEPGDQLIATKLGQKHLVYMMMYKAGGISPELLGKIPGVLYVKNRRDEHVTGCDIVPVT